MIAKEVQRRGWKELGGSVDSLGSADEAERLKLKREAHEQHGNG